MTGRSALAYGSGRRRSALATVKIAVFAPTPIASDGRAVVVNPGALRKARSA
jgi:hypothetical protein